MTCSVHYMAVKLSMSIDDVCQHQLCCVSVVQQLGHHIFDQVVVGSVPIQAPR